MHFRDLTCVKVAIWGEILVYVQRFRDAGEPIPQPETLIEICFNIALNKCIEGRF